jgi:hypothetical protein
MYNPKIMNIPKVAYTSENKKISFYYEGSFITILLGLRAWLKQYFIVMSYYLFVYFIYDYII